jgi:hypothetical protein
MKDACKRAAQKATKWLLMPVLVAGLAIGAAACGSRTIHNPDGGERRDDVADINTFDTRKKDKGKPDASIIDVALPDVRKDVGAVDFKLSDKIVLDKLMPDMLLQVPFCKGSFSFGPNNISPGQIVQLTSTISVKLIGFDPIWIDPKNPTALLTTQFSIYRNGILAVNWKFKTFDDDVHILASKETVLLSPYHGGSGTWSDGGLYKIETTSIYYGLCLPLLLPKDCLAKNLNDSTPSLSIPIYTSFGQLKIIAENGLIKTWSVYNKQNKYLFTISTAPSEYVVFDNANSRFYIRHSDYHPSAKVYHFYTGECKPITSSSDAGPSDAKFD